MYELFITNKNYSSWSLRPWVLMRQLELGFRERLVPLPEGSCWDTFRAFSPSGRVPCLHDGDTVVWDTLGITEYLAERHAACGRPIQRRGRGRGAPPPRCTRASAPCASAAP